MVSLASGAQADLLVCDGEKIQFGECELEVAATPGHTAGCVTYLARHHGKAFTGDALLVRGCGRTDFQGGSAATLYRSVWDRILSLPESTVLYPAHDYKGQTATTVGEERRHNPRLTKSEPEFIQLMQGLNLAYPKKIGIGSFNLFKLRNLLFCRRELACQHGVRAAGVARANEGLGLTCGSLICLQSHSCGLYYFWTYVKFFEYNF